MWIDNIPQNEAGQIIVPYAGQHENGEYIEGVIDKADLLELLGENPNTDSPLWQMTINYWKANGYLSMDI